MAGKDFSQLENTRMANGLTLTQNKHLTGLIKEPREVMAKHTVETAFHSGLPIQKALKAQEPEVRLLLLSELERLIRQVGATRTFQDQTDTQNAIEDIIEVFPSLKLEEILMAFKHIRQGRYKLYSTFTTMTLIECVRKYEMEITVPQREKQHKVNKHEALTAAFDAGRLARDLLAQGKIKAPRKTLDRYIPLPTNLETYEEVENWRQVHLPQTTKESQESTTADEGTDRPTDESVHTS